MVASAPPRAADGVLHRPCQEAWAYLRSGGSRCAPHAQEKADTVAQEEGLCRGPAPAVSCTSRQILYHCTTWGAGETKIEVLSSQRKVV